jgi:hypothetical protein
LKQRYRLRNRLGEGQARHRYRRQQPQKMTRKTTNFAISPENSRILRRNWFIFQVLRAQIRYAKDQ